MTMHVRLPSRLIYMLGISTLLLAGCSSAPRAPAPVVDRSAGAGPQLAPVSSVRGGSTPAIVPAVEQSANLPSEYVVRPGDTLYQIALEHGQDWRDIASWNGLSDPDRILVGQRLVVRQQATAIAAVPPSAVEVTPIAPPSAASSAVVAPPVANTAPSAAATPSPPAAASASSVTGSAAPPAGATVTPSAQPTPPVASVQPAARPNTSSVAWAWPVSGRVIDRFHETRNKGIDIEGPAGTPIAAAADGRVVYAGSGLRGYGNLVIVKHSDTYLSAYAHNRRLLVQEGQDVQRGQSIAELGDTDAPSPRLHFEIRRNGRPIDPLTQLPPR